MIYTIGFKKYYDQYFSEQWKDKPRKLGRIKGKFCGGPVWKTKKEAQECCKDGYAVYGVMADWDKETEPNATQNCHDLLVTSELIKLK